MSSILTDTGILNKSYNNRALLNEGADIKNLVRTDSGVLWAAVNEDLTDKWINIYRSDDNGFTWVNKYRGNFDNTNQTSRIAGLNQNGNFTHLTYHEHERRLILWQSYSYFESGFGIKPWVFSIEANGDLAEINDDTTADTVSSGQDGLAFDITYNADTVYLTRTAFSQLAVDTYSIMDQSFPQNSWQTGNTFFNVLSTVVDENNILHIVVLKDLVSRYNLVHYSIDKNTNQFSSEHNVFVQTATNDILDVSLDLDSDGNLGVVFTMIDQQGVAVPHVGVSTNNGTTWNIEPIPSTAGQSSYTDAVLGRAAGRTTIMGGDGGFIFSYVRDYNDTPTAYVRTLLTYNGTEYLIGAEEKAVDINKPVVGVSFFRPPGAQQQSLADPGQIRIAYQVGEGNSPTQEDTIPVTIGQSLLKHHAYKPRKDDYDIDEASDGQVLVVLDVVEALSNNVDFWDLGIAGNISRRYEAAFRKVGSKIHFERYEPNPGSLLNDRTGYELDSAYTRNAVVDVLTYELPFLPDQDDFNQYIEKDIRKFYLPPSFHLGRTLLLNEGNYLKRTVWLAYYDGNTYELTQVVPYFINDQICLYTANGYVVGPSRDPFSRTILPSET